MLQLLLDPCVAAGSFSSKLPTKSSLQPFFEITTVIQVVLLCELRCSVLGPGMWLALYSGFPKSGCKLQRCQPVNKQELVSIQDKMDPGSSEREESQSHRSAVHPRQELLPGAFGWWL